MKCEHLCDPQSGKLVHQFPRGITFAYDLYLGHSRDRWKYIVEDNNCKEVIHHAFRYGVL